MKKRTYVQKVRPEFIGTTPDDFGISDLQMEKTTLRYLYYGDTADEISNLMGIDLGQMDGLWMKEYNR
ncbi:MAG: hypothetical protein HRU19_02930 [Pseudobacteriovorax sp.]|nr:hypothetical protein [Pseudobacteriovorax sp.]